MNVSLYQAAAAMNAQARWQELITQNLASSGTPGFRKQDVSFSAIQAGLDQTANNSNAVPYVIPKASSSINFSQGELTPTGNPMDFALEGPGFFEVQMPDGTKAYTRDGEFRLNAQGQIVTQGGNLVMGAGGPIQLNPSADSSFVISPNGEVTQAGEVRGRINLVEFDNNKLLTPISSGYFLAENPGALPKTAASTFVRQGFIEGSNASPTSAMADLINSMRLFESSQRVMQMQDDRMGKVISTLGNPT